MAANHHDLATWWEAARCGRIDEQKKKEIAMAIYVIWHIWKERGRRIFEDDKKPAVIVVGLVKADLELLRLAKGMPTNPA